MQKSKAIGVVKSYVSDKGYGFISKEDGTVFFHKNDLKGLCACDIKVGAVLKFEEMPTAKGNKAVNVELASDNDLRYEIPTNNYYINQAGRVPDGLVIIDKSDFYIRFSIRDPSLKQRYFSQYLSYAEGANAVFDIRHSTSTCSEMSDGGKIGGHKYTVHNFSGRIGRVGKISSRGRSIEVLPDINNNLFIRYAEELKRKKSQDKFMCIVLMVILALMIIAWLILGNPLLPCFGAGIAIAIWGLILYLMGGNEFLDHLIHIG